MKTLLDIGPLGVFFVLYYAAGLMPAIAGLMLATLLALAITYVRERKLALMPLISGLAVLVFGGLSLWLHDETFIKMKPTLINLLFAGILLFGVYCRKPMLKYVLGPSMQLKEEGWLILSKRWGLFFVFLALLNEYIWRNFSTEFWVSFKVFGMLSCSLLFTLAQIPTIKRYWIES